MALTPDIHRQIIGLLENGADPAAAAEATGVSERSVFEWVARGEGRSQKSSTPELEAFASDFRRAIALARAKAQTSTLAKNAPSWIRMYGDADSAEAEQEASPEEIYALAKRLVVRRLAEDPNEVMPRCSNARCRCPNHKPRAAS